MATNQYFESNYSATTADQVLVEELIIEAIQIHGRDLYYLPRDLNNFDSFFGEDQISSFNNAVPLEFYMENVQSWQDDGSFLSKFGMEIRDSATFAVSQKRFTEEITSEYPNITRPREGDILVLPIEIDNRKRAMEITFVRNEEIFYQIGKLYIWTVTVKNFEFSGEIFNTGIPRIDDYNSYALSTVISLEPGIGVFLPGETVSQITGFGGYVLSFNNTENQLVITNISGELDMTLPIIGVSTSRVIVELNSSTGNDVMMNDNDYIEKKTVTEGLISFSESNPFSEQ